MKLILTLLKKVEVLSALSVRLTKLTGKSKIPLHPKHLLKSGVWFSGLIEKKDRILDLGCNAGQTSFKIAPRIKEVIGIDVDQKLITIAKKQKSLKRISNAKFFTADANNKLPFENNFFDKVICSDVLEHLEKRDFALSEIRRVLRPGGLLFLVCDNPETSWKRLQKSAGLFYYADRDHKYEYPKNEILSKLKSRKLKIISIETVTYDTPLKGFIDLIGAVSLELYKRLGKWRENMVKKHPEDTTGYKIVAQKV